MFCYGRIPTSGDVIQHRLTSFLREPLFCFKFLHLVATGSEPNRAILRCFSKLHNFFFFTSTTSYGKSRYLQDAHLSFRNFLKNICQIICSTKIINYHSNTSAFTQNWMFSKCFVLNSCDDLN